MINQPRKVIEDRVIDSPHLDTRPSSRPGLLCQNDSGILLGYCVMYQCSVTEELVV